MSAVPTNYSKKSIIVNLANLVARVDAIQDVQSLDENGVLNISNPVAFNDNLLIVVNEEPVDADLAAGQLTIWFDKTNGATKLMVKAKDAGGTVVVGELVLAEPQV